MANIVDITASLLAKYPQFAVLPTTQIEAFADDALNNVQVSALPTSIQLQALVLKTCEMLSASLSTDTSGLKLKREKSSQGENEYFDTPDPGGFGNAYYQLVRPYLSGFTVLGM